MTMEFFRQEFKSWFPFPSPGDLLDPEIKPGSPALQSNSLLSELQGKHKLLVRLFYFKIMLSFGIPIKWALFSASNPVLKLYS